MTGATEPWAFSHDERRKIIRAGVPATHDVRITVYGTKTIVKLRDTSVARSDHDIATGAVTLGTIPNENGILVHFVRSGNRIRTIWEHPNGRLTTNGRAIKDPMGFTWNPLPPILSVMRLKSPPWAELVKRPIVPLTKETVAAATPAPVPASRKIRRGRPAQVLSLSNALRHYREATFMGGEPE